MQLFVGQKYMSNYASPGSGLFIVRQKAVGSPFRNSTRILVRRVWVTSVDDDDDDCDEGTSES